MISRLRIIYMTFFCIWHVTVYPYDMLCSAFSVIDAQQDFKNDREVQNKVVDDVRAFIAKTAVPSLQLPTEQHPFSYDLKLVHIPAQDPNAQLMVCLHGYGSNSGFIYELAKNSSIKDHLISFNFPDAGIVDGQYDPLKTTFGSIDELLPAIYVFKQCIERNNLSVINAYGFSAGGGALINILCVLNSNRYDKELSSIGIEKPDKKRILDALQQGKIILDCPLKSMEEIIELRGYTYPLDVVTTRYRLNNLRPIDSLSGLQGLRLSVFLYFATPDEMIFNRDDELYIQKLKAVNYTGATTVICADEGGHCTQHTALWKVVSEGGDKNTNRSA